MVRPQPESLRKENPDVRVERDECFVTFERNSCKWDTCYPVSVLTRVTLWSDHL